MQEIDVVGNIAESKIHFILNPVLWDSFRPDVLEIISSPESWDEVKLLDCNNEVNPQLFTIPNDKGGIYLFLAKPNILPNSCLYLMYVGRSHITRERNLRKRCSEYPTEMKRPKIKRMIRQWGQYLYIRYLPLEDNDLIDLIENEIISKLLPPFNDVIPDQTIRDAVKAFD